MSKTLVDGQQLAVAVMVKNDAARLRRCLESVQPLTPNLIVLDTGSTDDSVKIAKSLGAKVYETTWPDMFDVALNEMLEKVDAEWTLRLDSDEWFEPDALPIIAEAIRRDDVFLIQITRRDFNPSGYGDLAMPRLWRTHPDMRYVGVVHEHFPQSVITKMEEKFKVMDVPVLLLHDGYAEGISDEKRRRNLELIRKELELRPGQLYYEVCEIDTMSALQDAGWEKVLFAFIDRLVNAGKKPSDPLAAIPIARAIAGADQKFAKTKQMERWIKFALQHYSMFPMVLWACSVGYEMRGDLREALDLLLKLDEMRVTRKFETNLAFDPRVMAQECWKRICAIAPRVGKKHLVAGYQSLLFQHPR
jgi:glycosyltransferase involved in cell wall biosynthesis